MPLRDHRPTPLVLKLEKAAAIALLVLGCYAIFWFCFSYITKEQWDDLIIRRSRTSAFPFSVSFIITAPSCHCEYNMWIMRRILNFYWTDTQSTTFPFLLLLTLPGPKKILIVGGGLAGLSAAVEAWDLGRGSVLYSYNLWSTVLILLYDRFCCCFYIWYSLSGNYVCGILFIWLYHHFI